MLTKRGHHVEFAPDGDSVAFSSRRADPRRVPRHRCNGPLRMNVTESIEFRRALERNFPGAVLELEYVTRTARHLHGAGFTAANTLAWVAVCRDEIAGTLLAEVEAIWGASFSFASLAGLPTAGRTGFSAAAHHGPIINATQHFVAFAMAHIAISADGVIGEIHRPGLPYASMACGALVAFRNELAGGKLTVSLDPFDIEQTYLKQRLLPLIDYGTVPDLVELTRLTADAIEHDSRSIFQDVLDEHRTHGENQVLNIAFLTGIQIHGPGGVNYVCPRCYEITIDGRRLDLGQDWALD